jgi:cyclopropane fatty-acyl-phospholipid synthase-like methyltransferase
MAAERKNRTVYSLSLSAEERKVLAAKAKQMGLTLGTFIKMAAFQYKVPAK